MSYVGLFEGISGFGLAFKRAGATIRAVCEINPDCQKVLRRHHPEAELISDVKEINKDAFNGEPITVLAGGFPCQDLSVAGLRKGLDGERSGLWFEFIRIIGDHQPGWVVIENVPGLLSSNNGRDFAIVLRGLVECGYGVCWRVFDSQYDNVAQRRERVFIVASFGSERCCEILFERDGCAWDSPPSRETGEGVAGTLSARTSAGGGLGTDFECSGGLQSFGLIGNGEYAERPATLRANGGDCGGGSEHLIAGTVSSKRAKGTGGPSGDGCQNLVVAPTMRSNGDAHSGFTTGDGPVIAPQITHTLRGEGFDASEDGTGRGTPLIAFAVQEDNQNGVIMRDIAGTLRADAPGHQPCGTLAFTERTRAEGRTLEAQEELAYALTNPGSGGRTHSRQIAGQFGVRRLTPTECERLQGFPDSHTAFGTDGKPISDSARYRMLGNAVCVPTAEWIARRIMKMEVTN
jgi:DNA (cytosine-5)-methyltransferase 1